MSATRAHHPTLHTVPLDHQPPELLASRCGECDYLAFPASRFGCPSCGAARENSTPVSIAGQGTLEAFTIVHRTFSRSFPAPYAVGTILLDAGVEIRAVLAPEDLTELEAGARVESCLVPIGEDEEGNALVDCRFRPVPAEASDSEAGT